GFNTYKANMGDLANKGVEVNMSFIPIRTKEIMLSFSWNGAHNKNKITKISDALKKYNETVNQMMEADEENVSTVFLFEEGQSMNTIYAVRSLGIDPGTGKEIYLTLDGEKTFDWKAKDQVAVGNTEPTLRGYFGFNFRYKAWELGGNFGYSFGADKYNYTLYERIENVNYDVNNDRRALTERWQKPGDIAKYKAIGDGSTTKATSRFVQRENKLELTSLRFTYNMPSQNLKDKFISMWRFSVTCNDLFHVSTVKQERGLTYPYARTITFSTQLNF
ncbi:MAG: SusC/RagA family TonB-linked outer membrane protein, partial [Odoribacter sp.]|nr:SusC/RagA family TonB-linked outer membrane protein [Odoribacter sp.]